MKYNIQTKILSLIMLMILEFVQKNLPDRHRRENVRKGPIFGRSRQTASRVPIRGWLFYVYLSRGTRNNASRISRNLLFSAISQECITSASTSTSMMLFHGRQSPANDHLSSEREGKKKADYIRDFSLPQPDRCSV